ncbi:MAG: stalk domain-containing protein [Oscillospiraceae bacterium]|nr:stalk domain-containing protein [Oscillospiraceae bacterium]
MPIKLRKIRFMSFAIVLSMAFACLCGALSSVSADDYLAGDYRYPAAYWSSVAPFNEAVRNGAKNDIIKHGETVLQSLRNEPDRYVMGNRAAVYTEMIKVYQELENYEKAVEYLKLDIDAAGYLEWDDRVKGGKAKLLSLDLNVNIYAETKNISDVPYFNRKLEPRNGIYIGRVANKEDSDKIPLNENEGIISFYALFGTENFESFDWFIRPYDDANNRIIHFAWNLFEEADGLGKVAGSSYDRHIIDTLKYINSMKSPTMLRIFAEMNVWKKLPNPADYKAAYLKIARLAREHAPDTALIFAPNNISEWNTDMHDFYPGDEYVDWVGVSLYSSKFFTANDPTPRNDFSESFYFNGVYANPIVMLKEIAERYGSSRPIIITEGAAGHTIKNTGMDLTDSAVKYMNQIYRYASMVFPQIKAAVYFDVDLPISNYSYRLSSNQATRNAYFNAVNANPAANKNLTPSNTAYVTADKFGEKTDVLNLSAYAVFPNEKQTAVEYFLNGSLHTRTVTLPYSAVIDTGNIAAGNHKLRVEVKNGAYAKTFDYILTKTSAGIVMCRPDTPAVTRNVTANFGATKYILNGEALAAESMNYNDRAYLPAAYLAAKLGLSVSWDSATNTTTLTSTGAGPVRGAVNVAVPQANPGRRTISATFGAPVYILNGEVFDEQAITYNGTAYLPAAYLAAKLGLDSSWDSATNTTTLTSK